MFKNSENNKCKSHQAKSNLLDSAVYRSVPLTLAGHAYWMIARLADAVTEGGAARLGGVLRVGA